MAAEQPLVSVVVPTRDRPELLRRAVAAILGQTYEGPVECVVVFDQSDPDLAWPDLPPGRTLVLRRIDRWLVAVHGDLLRNAPDPLVVDLGYGATPITAVELHLRLSPSGRVSSLAFDRWGDPDGHGFGWHRFGGQITGYASFGGLTVPAAGRLGWGWGGDGWERGEFFRYRITALEPSGAEPPARSR